MSETRHLQDALNNMLEGTDVKAELASDNLLVFTKGEARIKVYAESDFTHVPFFEFEEI